MGANGFDVVVIVEDMDCSELDPGVEDPSTELVLGDAEALLCEDDTCDDVVN